VNLLFEVSILPRSHRICLVQYLVRSIKPSYDEKVAMFGRLRHAPKRKVKK
jgi:hypothetical protein